MSGHGKQRTREALEEAGYVWRAGCWEHPAMPGRSWCITGRFGSTVEQVGGENVPYTRGDLLRLARQTMLEPLTPAPAASPSQQPVLDGMEDAGCDESA